jgi:uncharacterized protein YciI
MQYLLIAFDGTDDGAAERRIKSRPEHLEKISVIKRAGNFLFGGAILDESGNMVGSMILYEAENRSALDAILEDEPYLRNGVWKRVEIKPFRLAQINL